MKLTNAIDNGGTPDSERSDNPKSKIQNFRGRDGYEEKNLGG